MSCHNVIACSMTEDVKRQSEMHGIESGCGKFGCMLSLLSLLGIVSKSFTEVVHKAPVILIVKDSRTSEVD